jgi:lysine-specific demethylase/histidyl-hydroxylase NO66
MSKDFHDRVKPISAFLMYKNTTNKQIIKKKKLRPKKETALKSIQKQKRVKVLKRNKQNLKKSIVEEPVSPEEIVADYSVDANNIEESDGLVKLSVGDDPIQDAVKLYKWLISPLLPESFFKTYWEEKPVHIKRSNRNYYSHILNSSALDKMFRNHNLYYTKNVDVVSYENGVKEVHNQEGRATPSALWDYYANGCSIRILNPQTYNHKVHLLLATLQEYFGTMVGSNVYLTPPGSQGFAPHYDDIEAFVIQLEGRKHWKLYQPKEKDVLARYSSPNLRRKNIGEPFMELTLEAGEVLYFPRGTIHEGCTDENSHSLHITVSVYQRTAYADLLENLLPAALKKAAENNVEYRKGLPLHYLKKFGVTTSSRGRNLVTRKVQDLICSLVNYMDIDIAADLLGRKFMYDSMPPILSKSEMGRTSKEDGPYLDKGKVVNRVEINPDTRIRLLRYYCIRVVNESYAMPKLYYNTENAAVYHGEEEQWLELDPCMIPTISMLQNTYPCYIEVEKLPMEDESVKMQLIADLWERGLLVSEEPLESIDD